MHRDRLTSDSLLQTAPDSPSSGAARRPPIDPRPPASQHHREARRPAGLSASRRRAPNLRLVLRVSGNGVNRSYLIQGGSHMKISPTVTVDGGRQHRAVRVARRHVDGGRELRHATPARSTARAPSTRARRCRRPPASSSPPTARATTRAGSRASSSPTSPRPQSFSKVFEVADNAPGAPQLVATIERPRHADRDLQRPEQRPPATRTRSRSITFINAPAQPINVARRVGNGDGALDRRAEPDHGLAQHRRLEHVHVPHRAARPERDHHRRRAPGRPRDARGHLRRLRRRDRRSAVGHRRDPAGPAQRGRCRSNEITCWIPLGRFV